MKDQATAHLHSKSLVFYQKLCAALPDFEGLIGTLDSLAIDPEKKQIIFLPDASKLDFQKFNSVSLHPESILLLKAKKNALGFKLWSALSATESFHFTADAWHFYLLSPRPKQAKQHFFLKLT